MKVQSILLRNDSHFLLSFSLLTSVICFFIPLGPFNLNTSEFFLSLLVSLFLFKVSYLTKSQFSLSLLLLIAFLLSVSYSSLLHTSFNFSLGVRYLLFIVTVVFSSSVFHSALINGKIKSLLRQINKFSFYALILIFMGSLFNLIVSNEVWSGILSSINLLPSTSLLQQQSWWSNSNGTISFYITPNALCISIFYISVLYLLTNQDKINRVFWTVYVISICTLILCRSMLGLFCCSLLSLDLFLHINSLYPLLSIPIFKIKRIQLIVLSFIALFTMHVLANFATYSTIFMSAFEYLSIFTESSSMCNTLSLTSECVRGKYLQESLSYFDGIQLFGSNNSISFSSSTHNQFIDLLLFRGLIPSLLFLVFIFYAGLHFLFINKKIGTTSFSLFMMLAPLQGDIFTDSRNFLPFLLSLLTLNYLQSYNTTTNANPELSTVSN